MKDPISINITCQGCGRKKRKSIRHDGDRMFCFTPTPEPGEERFEDGVEFEMDSLLDDIVFSICFLGGKKGDLENYRILCQTCSRKVYKMKQEEGKKQRKRILESLYTRGR